MSSIFGEYKVTMDTKGRMMIPAEFRRQLEEQDESSFVIKRGMNNCLTLYLQSQWSVMRQKLDGMNDFNPKVQQFKRLFLDGIAIVEPDSAGRLLMPKHLQEYAGLSKDVVFWAQGNKVEIWDKEAKDKYVEAQMASMESLASELFSGV
ncbi:division/cell wall cluster transcriptional repressor MraZ [Haoranjiania flava]|uniref:Transcriptional regulator MraZ n=1 Tax=Haoranjiania flava TaxID=1856322 RepID=A0AAE3IM27_9BACT|nr:division/cell wall cluster transcriptional repressor MraZ [Haoranjiania flava]MCU7694383.1 division/cell wall cluster transcriptional repressor MraZ [Haoranjiania flava]